MGSEVLWHYNNTQAAKAHVRLIEDIQDVGFAFLAFTRRDVYAKINS